MRRSILSILLLLCWVSVARADLLVGTPITLGDGQIYFYYDVGYPSNDDQSCNQISGGFYYQFRQTGTEVGTAADQTFLGNNIFPLTIDASGTASGRVQKSYTKADGSEDPCKLNERLPDSTVFFSWQENPPDDPEAKMIRGQYYPGPVVTRIVANLPDGSQTVKLVGWQFNPAIGTPTNPGPAGTIIFRFHGANNADGHILLEPFELGNVRGTMRRARYNMVEGQSYSTPPTKLVAGTYFLRYGPTSGAGERTGTVTVKGGRAQTYDIYIADNSTMEQDPCNINPAGCVDASPSPTPTPTPTPSPSPLPSASPSPSPSPNASPSPAVSPSPSPSPGADGDQNTHDWWGQMLRKAFVPSQASLDNLKAAWGRLCNWGPFGGVAQIQQGISQYAGACSTLNGTDTDDACSWKFAIAWDICKGLGEAPCPIGQDVNTTVDLRAPRPLDNPYPDGGVGSAIGGVLSNLRKVVLGPMVYILTLIGFVRSLTPKPTT